MRNLILSLAGVALIAGGIVIGTSLPTATAAGKVASGPYGLDVALAPSSESAGAVEFKLVVTDLASGKAVAAPRVTTPLGVEAEIANSTADGTDLRGTMKVSEDGKTATYVITMTKGTAVLAKHSGSVSLNQ